MQTDLLKLFNFVRYSAQLRSITRNYNATPDRKESSAEHSWHLSLVAWLLHAEFEKEFRVNISLSKMIKMCIMHDLVEIEAGDVSIWDKDKRIQVSATEEDVAQTMFSRLPDFLRTEFLDLWHEYESQSTLEARIVKGIDRLNPSLMKLLTGQGWASVNGTVEKLDAIQLPCVAFSQTLSELYGSIKIEALESKLLGE